MCWQRPARSYNLSTSQLQEKGSQSRARLGEAPVLGGPLCQRQPILSTTHPSKPAVIHNKSTLGPQLATHRHGVANQAICWIEREPTAADKPSSGYFPMPSKASPTSAGNGFLGVFQPWREIRESRRRQVDMAGAISRRQPNKRGLGVAPCSMHCEPTDQRFCSKRLATCFEQCRLRVSLSPTPSTQPSWHES
ncbi:hypothetical protein BD289DRAFT_58340 [Coniella lustricola]|uniref:Uncharacterized protein n=1 Tax=Coniella lustricola TaxID=2025994 RepID=A0A2T3AIG3_9PEZI|nr:hypothetical protein BD289DRAFT_58340 [Coniella lustricola]